jgi:hypothetical protein
MIAEEIGDERTFEACDETIPFEVCEALAPLVVQLRNLDEAIARLVGNRNLRKLLVVGAHAVLFHRKLYTNALRMRGWRCVPSNWGGTCGSTI